jgi:hypothetical protein
LGRWPAHAAADVVVGGVGWGGVAVKRPSGPRVSRQPPSWTARWCARQTRPGWPGRWGHPPASAADGGPHTSPGAGDRRGRHSRRPARPGRWVGWGDDPAGPARSRVAGAPPGGGSRARAARSRAVKVPSSPGSSVRCGPRWWRHRRPSAADPGASWRWRGPGHLGWPRRRRRRPRRPAPEASSPPAGPAGAAAPGSTGPEPRQAAGQVLGGKGVHVRGQRPQALRHVIRTPVQAMTATYQVHARTQAPSRKLGTTVGSAPSLPSTTT